MQVGFHFLHKFSDDVHRENIWFDCDRRMRVKVWQTFHFFFFYHPKTGRISLPNGLDVLTSVKYGKPNLLTLYLNLPANPGRHRRYRKKYISILFYGFFFSREIAPSRRSRIYPSVSKLSFYPFEYFKYILIQRLEHFLYNL